jgi:hypothetical protein
MYQKYQHHYHYHYHYRIPIALLRLATKPHVPPKSAIPDAYTTHQPPVPSFVLRRRPSPLLMQSNPTSPSFGGILRVTGNGTCRIRRNFAVTGVAE